MRYLFMPIRSPADMVEEDHGGKLQTSRKIADQKAKSPSFASECEGLIEAARAVVRAHHLRDRDEADDGDVSDAIAELEDSLPRQRRGTSSKR